MSQLNFVELAGSEQAVNTNQNLYHNIKSTPIHEFVSKSFNSLSCHLMRLVIRKNKNNSSVMEDETKLISCLRSTMGLDSQILVITCVDPNPVSIEHSLPALKFCASLREQIHKKIKK